jgi:hypothetical protein
MADQAFNWDSTIQNDNSFTLLPDGTYPFTVTGFERDYHNGSDKLPPCPKAVVSIEVDGGSLGKVDVQENLFLHSRAEWKLCEFFVSLGLRKKGEPLQMPWNAVTGAHGMCELGHRTYKDNDYNQIKKFLEPVATPMPSASFKPGKF